MTQLPKWNEQKAKLKAKFPILTDEDLLYKAGNKNEMLSRLQEILGKTREEINLLLLNL